MITATLNHATRYTVRDGARVIGFLVNLTQTPSTWTIPHGWRFVANRKDIAARYQIPSPVFATADEALADINAKIGG